MKAILGLVGAALLAGCSQQQGSGPAVEQGSASSYDPGAGGGYSQDTQQDWGVVQRGSSQQQGSHEQKKLAFLQRIREADPQQRTIERALMNDRNELGIILSREVSMGDIPALMRSLLKQMAAEYPGENLTVTAYAPTEPPILIGTGRLDARSREMTYTPAQQQNQRR
jgi:hypothetical protein